jgi:hypothetical protein
VSAMSAVDRSKRVVTSIGEGSMAVRLAFDRLQPFGVAVGDSAARVLAFCQDLKNPTRLTKQGLPARRSRWTYRARCRSGQRSMGSRTVRPLFFSRKDVPGGGRRPISRQQAWKSCAQPRRRQNTTVLALRVSRYGQAGDPAPVHPAPFRAIGAGRCYRHVGFRSIGPRQHVLA